MDNINLTPRAKFDTKTILLWVLIGVIAFTGYFGWQWREIKEELNNQTKRVEDLLKQISDSQNKNNLIEDETAGWKTYRNEKYGFEIKYPDSLAELTEGTTAQGGEIYNITLDAKEKWEVKEIGKSFPLYTFDISIDNNKYNDDQEFFNKTMDYLDKSTEPVPYRLKEFAKKKWIEIGWNGSGFYGGFQIETSHDKYVYIFKFSMPSGLSVNSVSATPVDKKTSEGLAIFNQILSTFKFLN